MGGPYGCIWADWPIRSQDFRPRVLREAKGGPTSPRDPKGSSLAAARNRVAAPTTRFRAPGRVCPGAVCKLCRRARRPCSPARRRCRRPRPRPTRPRTSSSMPLRWPPCSCMGRPGSRTHRARSRSCSRSPRDSRRGRRRRWQRAASRTRLLPPPSRMLGTEGRRHRPTVTSAWARQQTTRRGTRRVVHDLPTHGTGEYHVLTLAPPRCAARRARCAADASACRSARRRLRSGGGTASTTGWQR